MSVSWTDWKTDDKDGEFAGPAKQDIRRTYSFPNIDSAGGIATLTIVCALEMTMLPDGENVSLDRKLRFYLRPFRLQHEANFIMGFMTRAESHGGEFDVLAAPSGDEDGMAIIAKYGGRNDVSACIATLRAGRDLVFSLQDEQESLVNFLLPNDDTFQRLYDETIQTLQQRAVLNQILRQNAELQHTQTTDAKPKAPKAMFIAKIVGVIPKGMSLTVAPSETRKFATQSEAVDWLLGEALSSLPTPVNSVEVLSPDGKSVWREWHWSHDALKTKNEKWWNERDPGRAKREKELSERRRKIASGEISGNELSDAERFQRDNPAWTGPYFAYIPTRTVDRGWIWFSQYWERPHIGLKYASKNWFLD